MARPLTRTSKNAPPRPYVDLQALTAPEDLTVLASEDGSLVLMSFRLSQPGKCEGSGELTPAESSVLQDIVSGLSNEEIGARRRTSTRTVANQVASLFRKLGVSSRAEIVTSGALLRGRLAPP